MTQEKKTANDQYRYQVTTPENLFIENIFVTGTGPIDATNVAVAQITTPEYEQKNGRGCLVRLTGVNVDENGVQR